MHMEVLDGHDNPIDPHSVDRSGAHTPNVTVRQHNGTFNALGAVKIDMPNAYSVYMHDTNQRNLFSDDYRFDSHGCSRVDNVRDLTAWMTKDQTVQFRNDVYNQTNSCWRPRPKRRPSSAMPAAIRRPRT